MTVLDHAPGGLSALIDATTGRSITYGQLRVQSRELLGPLSGERRLLFLLAGNDLFSAMVYAGALSSGHPVALLDAHMSTESLAQLIKTYHPHWIGGPEGTGERLVAAGVDVVDNVRSDGGALIKLGDAREDPLHPELSVLLTTSGTTGSRKLVRLSRTNLASNARSISEMLELSPRERPITSLPIHYSFGLSVLNSHWLCGAGVVLTAESVMQKSFWMTLSDSGCTSLAGVPYTFQMLERVGFRTMDLASLTTLQQAGGALDRRLTELYAEHMAARGGRLVVMYGQTEATARMAYVPPDRLLEKLGSAGVPIPYGSFEIETGAQSVSDIGEVVYRGPNVMMGYASARIDLERGDVLGGRLRTGDLGRLDDEGYLFLAGRSARFAKVFGLRLDLDDIETSLRESGPAATVGGADSVWGFCAFGTDKSLAEDARRLARKYRINHSAIRLRRVEQIPVTSSGKIDYEQVRRWMT